MFLRLEIMELSICIQICMIEQKKDYFCIETSYGLCMETWQIYFWQNEFRY